MEKDVTEYQFGTIEDILRGCEAEPTEPDRQMHRIHMAAEMRPTDGTALMKNRKSPGKKKAALERKL